MTVRWCLAIALLISTCRTSSAQTISADSISGVVRDSGGGPLPGVTVVVVGMDFQRTVFTDANGRFTVDGVVSGPSVNYSLKATLPGFEPFQSTVQPEKAANFTLRIGCHRPDLYVTNEMAGSVRGADAVFRFRIDSATPPAYQKVGNLCGVTEAYTATAIETVKDIKQPRPVLVSFVAFDHSMELGSEYIGLFQWDASSQRFHLPRIYIARVTQGEVRCGQSDDLPCGRVADVMQTLRDLVGR